MQETKNNREKLAAKQQAGLLTLSEVKLEVPEKACLNQLKKWLKQETVLKIEYFLERHNKIRIILSWNQMKTF